MHVAKITTSWIRSRARAAIAFFFKLGFYMRITYYALLRKLSMPRAWWNVIPSSRKGYSVLSIWRFLAVLHIRNKKCNAGVWCIALTHIPCAIPSWRARYKKRCQYSPVFLVPHIDHACRDASSWCNIYTNLSSGIQRITIQF